MRGFIKFCGGLFVVLGMLGFVLAVVVVMTATSNDAGGFGIAIALGTVIGSASITLIGGTAYMLCQIDSRLEHIGVPTTAATGASHLSM